MKKFWLYIFGGMGILGFMLWVCVGSLGEGRLRVYYLDVGQGDATLVRTPMSEYVLIDGGPGDKVLEELSAVMPFYERTIDVLILTHPHADHVNGFVDVLKRYNVRQAVLTGAAYGDSGYFKFLELAREKEVALFYIDGSGDYAMGSVVFDFLFPLKSISGQHFENINNSSIAFRMIHGEEIYFFSGDLEVEGETQLINAGLNLRADYFQAGHHGSRTSNSEDLLDKMNPSVAVISCGVDNQFKHPHAETLRKFLERGIEVFRTDLDGTVSLGG